MRYLTVRILVCLALAHSWTASAQSWSAEQEEVWKDTQTMLQLFFSGDFEAHYEYVHPEVIWWNTNNEVPGDLETAKELDGTYFEHGDWWLVMRCTPLTIQVFDTFAVVNTYCRGFRNDSNEGNPAWETSRSLLVMKKEGERWQLVSNYIDSRSE